jgi:hypothetical protein
MYCCTCRAGQQSQQQHPQLHLQQRRTSSDQLSHQISIGSVSSSAVFSPATIGASAIGSAVMGSGMFGPLPAAAAAAGVAGSTAGSGVWEMSWCRTAPNMEWAAQDAGIELGE